MTRAGLLALAITAVIAVVAGCSTTEQDGPGRTIRDPTAIPDAEPRAEPRSRYGNPDSYEVMGRRYHVMDSAAGHVQRGIASWYGSKFHGRRTSSGEPFDMYAMTAAHKRLPIPAYVRVKNLDNGRTITVRVNDRGPFARNRIIDLSYAAAAKLGMLETGTAPVEIRTVGPRRDATSVAASATDTATGGAVTYYVQVGAFRERANAYRMAGRAEAAELPAPVSVEPAAPDDTTLYRVRVGPLPDPARVDATTAALADAGVHRTHVVVIDD